MTTNDAGVIFDNLMNFQVLDIENEPIYITVLRVHNLNQFYPMINEWGLEDLLDLELPNFWCATLFDNTFLNFPNTNNGAIITTQTISRIISKLKDCNTMESSINYIICHVEGIKTMSPIKKRVY